MMKIVNGDLLDRFDAKQFDGIAHGCNCFYAMSSGIAASIRIRCVEAYKADLKTNYGCEQKLGTFSSVVLDSGIVFNLYTQYQPGGQKDVEQLYENIRQAFRNLNSFAIEYKAQSGKDVFRLGIPLIGAGIAGGDWEVIQKIVEEECTEIDVTVVKFVPGYVDLFETT